METAEGAQLQADDLGRDASSQPFVGGGEFGESKLSIERTPTIISLQYIRTNGNMLQMQF